MNGSATLVTLVFERIRPGEAVVVLESAELVDASLVMIAYARGQQVVAVSKYDGMGFVDTAVHWAEYEINHAISLGFIHGYGDRTFRPQRQVTRAEFAAMLVRALQLPSAADSEDEADAYVDHD
ncbi:MULTISPECIES: S-layer homology domain-containing protein [Paenibacillus]|uniref:S-layer homology domain-containing protein n=1 Tax=Paenibacillus TaxID=44249 RepID=UPI0002FCE5CA|nr:MULTISPECIES: S-layer homology domain-containing protein [unclassified Paenibacillus]OXL87551.1 hypothetical protein BCV73_34210 [Paenibacillus sp. SSG-1]